MEKSRFEELLESLNKGEPIVYEPRSRLEEHLVAIINKEGKEGLGEPRSRAEELLQIHAEQMANGGGGSGGGAGATMEYIPVPNGEYVETIYFNTSLSPEEVDKIITDANLPFGGDEGVKYIICQDNIKSYTRTLHIIDFSSYTGNIGYLIQSEWDGEQTFFYMSPSVAAITGGIYKDGWQDIDYMEVGRELYSFELGTDSELGTHNDKLKELINIGQTMSIGIEVSTEADMDAALVEENIGKIYKFTGESTSKYMKDCVYLIQDSNNPIAFEPEGTIEINTNGTHDVSTYAEANVNIPSSNEQLEEIKATLIEKGVATEETDSTELNGVIQGISPLKTLLDVTKSAQYLFYNYNGTSLDKIINYNDTENLVNTSNMFCDCTKLTTIPELNTSNVTNMGSMFDCCYSLTSIPPLDTNKVTNMSSMFKHCNVLTTIPELDTSKVTNMSSMFYECRVLTTIPELDTSKVTNMSSMFHGCSSLTTIPELDTSIVTSMSSTFNNCRSLTTIPLLDTSNVTNMNQAFQNCYSLTTVPLLDLSKVTNVNNMFLICRSLTNLTLKNIKMNLQIGSGTSWGHLLTLDSLINTCKECINVNATRTLTMGSENTAKLADVYVRVTGAAEEDETNPKLPCEVCSSTDEGAMPIADYMALKNWVIQ